MSRTSFGLAMLLAFGLQSMVRLMPDTTIYAETPKLSISLKHGTPLEQRKRDQIERLASEYDLKKFTITRDILIEQGVTPHSHPVLTLNGRFMDSDDLTLSQYVHEQGHWALGRHRAENRELLHDLMSAFPGIPTDYPRGSGDQPGSYFHLAVIMLEWQALEELVGDARARAAETFKQTDHYTALYALVLQNRPRVEAILHRHHIMW
jgi:hypothetical protein